MAPAPAHLQPRRGDDAILPQPSPSVESNALSPAGGGPATRIPPDAKPSRRQRETPGDDAPKNSGNREPYPQRTLPRLGAINGFAGCGRRDGPRPAPPFRAIAKAPAESLRCVRPISPNRKYARLHPHHGPAARKSARDRAHTIVET